MATVYNIKLTSHNVNFQEKELKEQLIKGINETLLSDFNEITIEVEGVIL